MKIQINDKDIKEKPIAYLAIGIAILVAGITMIVFHDFFLYVLMIAVGVALALDGATILRGLDRWNMGSKTKTLMIIKGIALILLGFCAVFFPFVLEDAISVLFLIIGIALCVSAAISLFNAWSFRKKDATVSLDRFLWEAGISLALAIIMFIGPQAIAGVAIIVIGAIVAFAGAVITIACIGELLK